MSSRSRLTGRLRRWAGRAPADAAPQPAPSPTPPEPVEVPAVFSWRVAAEAADDVAAVLTAMGAEHWAVQPLATPTTIWACEEHHWPAVHAALARDLGGRGYRLASGRETLPLSPDEPWGDRPTPSSVTVVREVVDGCTGRVNRDAACELQLWRTTPTGRLRTTEKTGVVHELPATGGRVETYPALRWDGREYPRPSVLRTPDLSEIDFPVDAVYLWVDDSDPAWRQRRDETRRRLGIADDHPGVAPQRFRDRGELRASLRSLEMYAPWIRRIYLVTDQQRPDWLDPASDRITLVDHRDIFTDPSVLPCFNTHAIGSQLDRVPGLADRYLIMNDDVLFNRAVTPYDFFTPEGQLKVVFSRARLPLLPAEDLTDLMRARANSARLIERDHGRQVTRLFAHVPVPQSLEVAREVAARYGAEIEATTRHPFRSPEDYEVNSWLHLHHALLTGRAVASPMRYGYLDISSEAHRTLMESTGGPERALVLCVNDVHDGPEADAAAAWLTQWLARRFPVPAAHERPAAPVPKPDPAGS